MKFTIARNDVAVDLKKKLVEAPALSPYIVAQISGFANIKVGVPGILSGSVSGFKPRTGKTKELGLGVVFKNSRFGFTASLFSKRLVAYGGTKNKFMPIFSPFTKGTKRGIPALPLWESFDAVFQASGIAESVINKALDDFDNNRIPDLSKYLALGIRRRRR